MNPDNVSTQTLYEELQKQYDALQQDLIAMNQKYIDAVEDNQNTLTKLEEFVEALNKTRNENIQLHDITKKTRELNKELLQKSMKSLNENINFKKTNKIGVYVELEDDQTNEMLFVPFLGDLGLVHLAKAKNIYYTFLLSDVTRWLIDLSKIEHGTIKPQYENAVNVLNTINLEK